MPSLWLDVQASVANALHNWESTRAYAASPSERRRPGFTESWGVRTDEDDDSNKDEASGSTKERPPIWGWSRPVTDGDGDTPLTLVQFRPAWALQLALRAAGVDHVVVNASYAVTEATGPLPYVRDGRALVGSRDDAMWHYLLAAHETTTTPRIRLSTRHRTSHVQVAAAARTEEPLSVQLLLDLVTQTLEGHVLVVLRYQDAHAWQTTERPRSLRAVHGNWFFGHWHVWAERLAAVASLPTRHTPAVVADVLRQATRAYAFLEQALQSSPQIFLDEQFSRLGLALFQHLLHAMGNVHLAPLLARYPGLVAYAQRIWEHYFDGAHAAAKLSPRNQANQEVNAANPFFVALPPADTSRRARLDEDSWQTHLIRLSHQVQEQQQQAAAARRSTARHAVAPATASPNETAEAAVAAYQTADQRWMASVLIVAVLAVAQMVRGAQVVGGE
jgi:hypothetical protein